MSERGSVILSFTAIKVAFIFLLRTTPPGNQQVGLNLVSVILNGSQVNGSNQEQGQDRAQ